MNNELRDAYEVEYDDCFDPYKDDDNEIMLAGTSYAKLVNEKARKVLKNYINYLHYDELLAFDLCYDNGKEILKLYTTRPGVFIGKYGHDIDHFMHLWKAEFGKEIEVKFECFHNGGIITT